MKKTILAIAYLFLLLSCDKEEITTMPEQNNTVQNEQTESDPEGNDEKEEEEFSGQILTGELFFPDSVVFNRDGGSAILKIKEKITPWYFEEFKFEGRPILLQVLPEMFDIFPDWDFLYSVKIKTEAHGWEIVKVDTEWMNAKKIDDTSMRIDVKPSSSARNMEITIRFNESLDITDTIKIIQQ